VSESSQETFGTRLKGQWREWTRGLSGTAVFVLLVSTLLIILFHENCSSGVFRKYFAKYFGASSFQGLYPAFYWYGGSFIMLFLIPLIFTGRVLKRPYKEMGLGLGDWRFGLKAVLLMFFAFLPILAVVSYSPAFQAKYPLFASAKDSGLHFVLYQLAYVVYFIGWEFIFRGFMLFGLKPSLGFYSVFVQTIPFALLHFGKPQIETIAAIIAGVLLGYLALRTRSFWYGWLLHSLIAVSNDLLAMAHKGWE
jgi:membrane protease YdiL (CAAX protease family)